MKERQGMKEKNVYLIAISLGVIILIYGFIHRRIASEQTNSWAVTSPTSPHTATTEYLTVQKGAWTTIHTDPEKEKIYFNPTYNNVKWLAVVNGDFSHPVSLVGLAEDYHFGNGVGNIDVSLQPQNEKQEAKFIVKRLTKK